MIDIGCRKIKGTNLKVVLTGHSIIGVFEGQKFYDKKGMTSYHKKMSAQWHADTMQERIAELATV